jgi:hypothetical protein
MYRLPRATLDTLGARARYQGQGLGGLGAHVLHPLVTRDVIGDRAERVLEVGLEVPGLVAQRQVFAGGSKNRASMGPSPGDMRGARRGTWSYSRDRIDNTAPRPLDSVPYRSHRPPKSASCRPGRRGLGRYCTGSRNAGSHGRRRRRARARRWARPRRRNRAPAIGSDGGSGPRDCPRDGTRIARSCHCARPYPGSGNAEPGPWPSSPCRVVGTAAPAHTARREAWPATITPTCIRGWPRRPVTRASARSPTGSRPWPRPRVLTPTASRRPWTPCTRRWRP